MTTRTKTDRAWHTAPTTTGKPRDTKKSQLIRLLSAKVGADVAAISGRLGWQPHTTRAAITGLKKAGYEVKAEKPDPDKPMRYRITGKPDPEPVTSSVPEPSNAG